MKNIIYLLSLSLFLNANSINNLKLNDALKILEKDNLEVNIALLDKKIAILKTKNIASKSYGKLDLEINALRTNNASNVFGFKLQSREASFKDFGFSEFDTNNNNLLNVQPNDLNNPSDFSHYTTELQYSLPLYTGGKISSYKKIAQKMTEMATLNKSQLLNEKIFQTKQSFFNIQLLNNYILNLKQINRNIQKLESTVRSMKQEGYAKKVDILEVQAKGANVLRMINKAKENKALAYQFLSFLLNKKINTIDTKALQHSSLNDIDISLNDNIDIKKAQLGVLISSENSDLQISSFLPNIGLFAKYGIYSNKLLDNISKKDAYILGINLKLNIFSGGGDTANKEISTIQYIKAKSNLALARKGTLLKISQIKTKIKSLNFDIKSLEKELSLAREIYKNYKGRYEEHLVSIADVLIKQSSLLKSLIELNKLKNNRNLEIFQLKKIIGNK